MKKTTFKTVGNDIKKFGKKTYTAVAEPIKKTWKTKNGKTAMIASAAGVVAGTIGGLLVLKNKK